MTLEQVRADIRSGKCKAIYMCSESMWWSHLDADVIDATMKAFKWGNIKDIEKAATSPLGLKLIINKDPKKWLATSERFTVKYGKHRLGALMKAHHQNNSMHFYNNWKRYNDLIDRERDKNKI